MRKFHLGDILSVTTGVMLSPRNMTGIRDILEYMTNSDLATIGLLAAKDKCTESLFEQFPQLKEVNSCKLTQDNCEEWLSEQINKYGEYLEVNLIY